MRQSTGVGRRPVSGPLSSWWSGETAGRRGCVLAALILSLIGCLIGVLVVVVVGGRLISTLVAPGDVEEATQWGSDSATLTVAVSPGMEDTFQALADDFNRQQRRTPDGKTMQVVMMVLAPEKMVDESLEAPSFQALAPDSSLWLDQLERRWAALKDEEQGADDEPLIPIGNRRTSTVVRYAASPIVIVAWEEVARDLGWPERAVGWGEIQQKATENADFKWNHPGTGHASGLLATLAEFYAGAGLTRGLTPQAATNDQTLEYVKAVEATVRFYGESEDVIVERLAAEGRDFLDAFVAQEQVVVRWNQSHAGERLVAIYPAEGTLWADHPLALLVLGGSDETAVTDNQSRAFHAFAEFLTGSEVQTRLLAAGYRPADLSVALDAPGSPFAASDAVDWRQPQTTLQIPSASVVEVVQNVWWYIKRPTNVYLVVDTSGSMGGNKLARTQEALQAFVSQIQGDRDQLGLIEFGTGVKSFEPLQPLDDDRRRTLIAQINQMDATGDTALLDAVRRAYDSLQDTADSEAINAIVAMTDGRENASGSSLADLERRFRQESPVAVVVFTIAFGNDADEGLLRRIADAGDGQFRRADETDIEALYEIISTYF
ncbi:MAG: VWA domain-containing protein [Anaerolineae bacterium]